jgi:3-oxoacyl-[acyl-carrier protein] reductase
MTSELTGHTVLVTGGSMGIGLACARELVTRGAKVFIAAREPRAVESALQVLREAGDTRVDGASGDVSDPDAVERLIEGATKLGTLSGVVNAAGVYGPIGPSTLVDPTAWWETIRINLFGTFLVTRAACRAMTRGGSIVLFAGGGAGSPFPNYTAYASSKVAVVRFAESVAMEVASAGIRVNAIAPGFVATRLHDQTLLAGEALAGEFAIKTKAMLEGDAAVSPGIAAAAVAFLISENAKAITGRFIAAPYDDWAHWSDHVEELHESDLFTLRRIVPRDRGLSWQ